MTTEPVLTSIGLRLICQLLHAAPSSWTRMCIIGIQHGALDTDIDALGHPTPEPGRCNAILNRTLLVGSSGSLPGCWPYQEAAHHWNCTSHDCFVRSECSEWPGRFRSRQLWPYLAHAGSSERPRNGLLLRELESRYVPRISTSQNE